MKHRRALVSAACAAAAISGSPTFADYDGLVTLINTANATGGKSIAAFTYNPTNDTAYVSSFGFTTPGSPPVMRVVTNVSTPASQVSTGVVTEAQLQLYYRDGDPNVSVSTPLQSGFMINPVAIGAIPAFGGVWISDASLTRMPGNPSVTNPAATKRLYRWNLQPVGPAGDPPPPFGDARDVMTTLTTLADMQLAAGTTSTTSNTGRQMAWSTDGQHLFAIDSSTAFDGLYKINAATGAITRILATDMSTTEPAVLNVGGVDRIVFNGGSNSLNGQGTFVNNTGGLDYADDIATPVRRVLISAAEMSSFLELPAGSTTFDAGALAADADGTLYFNDLSSGTLTGRRGIYKLDPQGRLAKVYGYQERIAAFRGTGTGNPNSNTNRMQFRTTTFGTGSASFPITQLMYLEQSASNFGGSNTVAGAFLFKTGDFDRDNDVDQDDISLFKAALTLRGITLSGDVAADQPKLRFDLNGNNEVSFKDVKILQQFYLFLDGDADIDKTVNIGDFAVLATNFNQAGKRWTEGDFTGDESVSISDFSILASNFNMVSPADAARSPVPEPAMSVLAAGMLTTLRRRR